MISTLRRGMPAAAILGLSLVLGACGGQIAATQSPVPPTPVPSADPAAREAYSSAMCPIFTSILEIEPQLADLRAAGETGDASGREGDIALASADLRTLLNELEEVPEWGAGVDLRYHLITELHGIRAQLLSIDEPGSTAAAATLAALPYLSSEAMDRAMQQAVQGGLSCEGAS